MEEWRDIKGYEGMYQVSNLGNVKSIERKAWNGRGYRVIKERIMKTYDNGYGYLFVYLTKDGEQEKCYIHRLVAEAFLENPDNLPEVNHISEDKTDNRLSNIEWCSHIYNQNYGTRNKRIAEAMTNHPKLSKAVIGINKVSGLIVEFSSAHEASRQLGIDQGHITDCLKGRYKSSGGFYWMYAEGED